MKRTCTKCNATLDESKFHRRSDRPNRKPCICKECQKAQWRVWNQNKRGGLRGFRKAHYAAPDEAPQQVVALAQGSLDAKAVQVFRLADGRVGFWLGTMKAPKGAEFVGLYDFEARPEYVAEDLAA